MNFMLYWIIRYIMTLASNIIGTCSIFKMKYIWSPKYNVIGILYLIIVAFFTRSNSLPDSVMSYSIVPLLIFEVYIQTSGHNKLMCSTITFFAITLLELIVTVFIFVIGNIKVIEQVYNINIGILRSVITFTIIVILKILIGLFRRTNKQSKGLINKGMLHLFGAIILALLFCIGPVVAFGMDGANNRMILIYILSCIIMTILIVSVFYWLHMSNEAKSYYAELVHIAEECLQRQQQYYVSILDKEEKTKKFRHDISNHLISIKYLHDKERYVELGEYLSGLIKDVNELKLIVSTGNDIVNVVVNEVIIINNKDDFNFNWNGVLPEEFEITSLDLCTIFSNLLKNAYEAVLNVKKDGKYILVNITVEENQVHITVKNSVEFEVQVENNRLITTKKDNGHHGFGTLNIIRCVQKNYGTISFSSTEKEFCVNISFPFNH